jgi:flagellar motor switch protein FliN/FliY
MFGNDPAELPAELSELQKAAASEALVQMISALGEGASRAARRQISISAGDIIPSAGDELSVARGVVKDDRIAIMEGEIRIGTHPASRLVHILPASLADALGTEKAEGATGPEMVLGAPQPTGPGLGQRVQAVQLGSFAAPAAAEAQSQGNLDLLLDVPLDVTAELGRTMRRVRDVLAMGPGSIVELDKMAGEPVDLLVNGKPIAKGEVVVIDENFAVRIIEILARDERLTGGL